MLYVALSLVVLLLGPLGVAALRTRPSLLAALDGFVVVSISGIVLLHVLPHALLEVGAWAFVPAVIGFALPLLLEGLRAGDRGPHGRWLVPLAAAGMAAHALLDGTVLRGDPTDHGTLLPVAVVLHRIPEGLAIWWLFRPLVGVRFAALVLGLVGAATVVGFTLTVYLGDLVPERWLVLLQALVAGCLLHVVAHHQLEREGAEGGHQQVAHVASGLGSLAGVGLIVASLLTHPVSRRIEAELGLVSTLRTLALTSAPPLVLALVASVVLRTFTSDRAAASLKPGPAWLEVVRGGVFGAFFPVCSCDVIALYRKLRASGAPNRSTVALLVSAPELELATLMLSAALLGPTFAVTRVACVAACGALAGLIVGSVLPPNVAPVAKEEGPDLGRRRPRLRRALRFALGETVEHTGPWLILGLVCAALLEPFVATGTLDRVPASLQIAGAAVLGIVAYLCASGVTPVIAILVHKGLAPGAAIAFLIMSAAANVRVLRPLARMHGRNHAAFYAVTMLALSVAVGHVAQVLIPNPDIRLHADAEAAAGWGALASLAGLGATVVVALLRRGPRFLLGQLLPSHQHA